MTEEKDKEKPAKGSKDNLQKPARSDEQKERELADVPTGYAMPRKDNSKELPRSIRSAPPPEFFQARDKFKKFLDGKEPRKNGYLSVLTEFTKELIKHGDYSIRFVEELEESEPTLLVSVNLPRGILPGDPEVFALHEIAQRISDKTGTNLVVTTTGVGGGGKRLEYNPAKIARAVGKTLLADVPNFYACESQLRLAFQELEKDESYNDAADVLDNLNALARIYFHLGLKEQAVKVLDRIEQVLSILVERVRAVGLNYSAVYPEFNEAAVLCAITGEYDRAFELIDKNFKHLAEYVEKHNIAMRREDPTDHEAYRLFGQLPQDLTFSRQEVRERILFHKEKLESVKANCQTILESALAPVERLDNSTP